MEMKETSQALTFRKHSGSGTMASYSNSNRLVRLTSLVIHSNLYRLLHQFNQLLHILSSCEVNLCVRNKLIKISTSNHPLSIILLSPAKHSFVWISREICTSTVYKLKQSKTSMLVEFDVRGQQGMDFIIEVRFIMNYINSLKLKRLFP